MSPKPAPLPTVVHRLVHEAVASRIRHRALLAALQEGPFDMDRYLALYATIYDRDHEALFALSMLSKHDFEASHAQWRRDDIERYGVPGRVETVRRTPSRKRVTKT